MTRDVSSRPRWEASPPGPLPTLALLTVLGLAVGCSQGADPVESGPGSTSQAPPPTSGDPTSSPGWQPSTPGNPVDPASVQSDYAAAVEAAIGATASGLTWTKATVSTEQFEKQCVVKVERVGSGVFPRDVVGLGDAVASALTDHGFPDVALQNDPDGALKFVAHDAADALFELRIKDQTTVTIRVATAATDCAG